MKKRSGISAHTNISQLKLARLKKSWTVRYVSEKVGVSLSTYTRWETGTQTPRPSSLDALCHIFSLSAEDLGFKATPTTKKYASDTKRTKRGTHQIADPDSALSLEQEEQHSLSQDLEQWAGEIARCWQLYMAGKQAELEQQLPLHLAHLSKPTLYPGPAQKTAAALLAQVYQLIALVDLQHGDFVAAQTSGTQALVYSQLSKDWNIYIASQIRLASIFTARKRIGSALVAYNDALRRINISSDNISPLLHSWIFAGLAEIQATMGREQEALQFLQVAFAVFPDAPEQDSCFSYAQFDRSHLFLYEGLVFLRLGQPRLAWDAFTRVDEIKPLPPERTRAEFLKHRTYTSLVLGNMIQSCIYLEAAVRAAQELHSDLAFSEVYALYEHMLAIWGQEKRVNLLARLFQR